MGGTQPFERAFKQYFLIALPDLKYLGVGDSTHTGGLNTLSSGECLHSSISTLKLNSRSIAKEKTPTAMS